MGKRGSKINPENKFNTLNYTEERYFHDEGFELEESKTIYIPVSSKTILNENDSPDIPFTYSLNPYQGCEHGCIYCYARNSHQYWGYSSGLDFESKILIKKDAAKLLEKQLEHPKWLASPIMLSGNTDCYQPAEKEYKITRQILEICWNKRHPVSIVTKSKLILRDLDLLEKLASEKLVHVVISVTSLTNKISNILEPRASSGQKRLQTIKSLSNAGIPVAVLLAPIIPSINSHEIYNITKESALAGALDIHPIFIRLNGDLDKLFSAWLSEHFPERKEKVLRYIKEMHAGKLNESSFHKRMKGEGSYRDSLFEQFKIAKKTFFKNRSMPTLNTTLFSTYQFGQYRLFEDE
jgi:DNA repair photolyase